MGRARAGLAFCFGLFGIGAQALLFRETFATFRGHDVIIELFLASWFLWIGVGAFLFRKSGRAALLEKARELLLIACLGAFCLQYAVILLLRDPARVESFGALTLPSMVGVSFLVTAPLCLLMGLLPGIFSHPGQTPTGYVYGLEAAGGFVGGLGVTVLLYHGMDTPGVFLILATLACASAACSAFAHSQEKPCWIKRVIATLALAAVLAGLGLRVDARVAQFIGQETWRRAVPDGLLQGRFRTAKSEYLYGTNNGRWTVVHQGRVYETVTDSSRAGRLAAMALSQNFTAQNVLVIGDGLAVCRSFLKSPDIRTLDWAAIDPDYALTLFDHLPESLQISDARFHCLAGDIRTALTGKAKTYDIVIVNLPEPVNASFHRFTSTEFFEQVKESLGSLGLLVLGVVNDECITSEAPAYQAAWIKSTLNAVFHRTIVVPQEDRTFVLAADTSYLQISPVTLETRFSLLVNAGEIFLPESLASVYHPDRMLAALEACDKVDLPEPSLVNADARPSGYLARLQQLVRPWKLSLAGPAGLVTRGGLTIVFVPIVLLVLVRIAYVIRTAPRAYGRGEPSHDRALESNVRLTTALAALVSVGTFMILIHAFQIHYGSLASNVGLLSALFMLGAASGAFGTQWTMSSQVKGGPPRLFSILCAMAVLFGLHAGGLIGAGFWIEHPWSRSVFVLWLWLWAAGVFCGGVLTLGASALTACRHNEESTPGQIEDTAAFGAAIGAALTSLLLVPIVGFSSAFHVIAAVVLACTVCVVAIHYRTMHPGPSVLPHRILTPIGYSLFALALCIIVGSHILAHKERTQAKSLDAVAIENWAQERKVSAKKVTLGKTAKEVTYHEIREDSDLAGYVFRSEDFAGTVYGFGGPMSIITFADPNGKLIDFRITRSRETPRYIQRIDNWMNSLKGAVVFGPEPAAGADVISGATLSCDAILKLLRDSGPRFAATVLAQGDMAHATGENWIRRINWPLACWLMSVPLAVAAIYHGRMWSRIVVLAYTAGVGGFWLNRQFSTDQVFRLLKGDELLASSVGGLCLLLGVPLLILLFGNLYCGYLCPFGALQELLGLLVPKRFKPKLSLTAIGAGRFVKYALLFVLVVAFFVGGNKRFLDADPLTAFFNRQFWSDGLLTNPALIAAVLVLAGALLVTRLWCRYLCPAGAFLSLLNLGGWLRHALPAKKFGRCEFGLGGRDHLDCIYCDRCRYDSPLVPTRNDVTTRNAPNVTSWLFLAVVVCIAIFVLTPVFQEAPPSASSETTNFEPAQATLPGSPAAEIGPMQRRRQGGR